CVLRPYPLHLPDKKSEGVNLIQDETYSKKKPARTMSGLFLSVAAAEPARLRSAAKPSQTQQLRYVRQTASAGLTTASQPNAASRARQLLQSLRRGLNV
ncbi:hypothetical protein, partial [Pseudomonas mandelii]|uniref:hypothetical protein n=1 Tax=Pseudomonas mandelii TaxID=75612 RepID=UPI00209F7896